MKKFVILYKEGIFNGYDRVFALNKEEATLEFFKTHSHYNKDNIKLDIQEEDLHTEETYKYDKNDLITISNKLIKETSMRKLIQEKTVDIVRRLLVSDVSQLDAGLREIIDINHLWEDISDEVAKRKETRIKIANLKGHQNAIDYLVEKWYDTDSVLELHEYLGMTWEEYINCEYLIPEPRKHCFQSFPITKEQLLKQVEEYKETLRIAVEEEILHHEIPCTDDVFDEVEEVTLCSVVDGAITTNFLITRSCFYSEECPFEKAFSVDLVIEKRTQDGAYVESSDNHEDFDPDDEASLNKFLSIINK